MHYSEIRQVNFGQPLPILGPKSLSHNGYSFYIYLSILDISAAPRAAKDFSLIRVWHIGLDWIPLDWKSNSVYVTLLDGSIAQFFSIASCKHGPIFEYCDNGGRGVSLRFGGPTTSDSFRCVESTTISS